jgi:hypothetical protein
MPTARRGYEPQRGMATQGSGHGTRQFSIDTPLVTVPTLAASAAATVRVGHAHFARGCARSYAARSPAVLTCV